MARYKTRAEKNIESAISKYMEIRKAMGEIRDIAGLGDQATLEDIIVAVKKLAAKGDGESL